MLGEEIESSHPDDGGDDGVDDWLRQQALPRPQLRAYNTTAAGVCMFIRQELAGEGEGAVTCDE